mmetsp:Transcript_17440/g.19694  ORF Transcript_17440/g.19694 Transcript_17440/m.19694 type:complete len:595 (-) Transcript_17440:190-1974(-)
MMMRPQPIIPSPKGHGVLGDLYHYITGAWLLQFSMAASFYGNIYKYWMKIEDLSIMCCDFLTRTFRGFGLPPLLVWALSGMVIPYWLVTFMVYRFHYNYILGETMYGGHCWIVMMGLYWCQLCFFIISVKYGPGNITLSKEEVEQVYETHPHLRMQQTMLTYCARCDIPRVLRSAHCILCNKCIPKFENHDLWMNTCVGAGNQPVYTIFVGLGMLVSGFAYLSGWIRFVVECLSENSTKNVDIMLVYLIFFAPFFLRHYFKFKRSFERLIFNITTYETRMWMMTPYLWKNQFKQFHNAFDKGVMMNLLESLIPLEIVNQKQLPILMPEKGPFYNWKTTKLYTVMEVTHSPMVEIIQAIEKQFGGHGHTHGPGCNHGNGEGHGEHNHQHQHQHGHHNHQNQQQEGHVHGPGCNHGHQQHQHQHSHSHSPQTHHHQHQAGGQQAPQVGHVHGPNCNHGHQTMTTGPRHNPNLRIQPNYLPGHMGHTLHQHNNNNNDDNQDTVVEVANEDIKPTEVSTNKQEATATTNEEAEKTTAVDPEAGNTESQEVTSGDVGTSGGSGDVGDESHVTSNGEDSPKDYVKVEAGEEHKEEKTPEA